MNCCRHGQEVDHFKWYAAGSVNQFKFMRFCLLLLLSLSFFFCQTITTTNTHTQSVSWMWWSNLSCAYAFSWYSYRIFYVYIERMSLSGATIKWMMALNFSLAFAIHRSTKLAGRSEIPVSSWCLTTTTTTTERQKICSRINRRLQGGQEAQYETTKKKNWNNFTTSNILNCRSSPATRVACVSTTMVDASFLFSTCILFPRRIIIIIEYSRQRQSLLSR